METNPTSPDATTPPQAVQEPAAQAAPPQAPGPDLAALQAKLVGYEATLAQREQEWGQERELLRAGVLDSEAQEVARLFYGRLPSDSNGAKPSISQWLSQREALPKAVQAYLPQAQAQAPVQQTQVQQSQAPVQAAPPVQMPDANRGAGVSPQAGSSFSPQAIKSMSPDEYARNRSAILASLGKR
jgi:hypothetical protein